MKTSEQWALETDMECSPTELKAIAKIVDLVREEQKQNIINKMTTINIRCKCAWCEPWNERRQTLDEWKTIMYEYISKDPVGYAHVNEDSKEKLLELCDELLNCSGPFEGPAPVHSLCLAVKELLK